MKPLKKLEKVLDEIGVMSTTHSVEATDDEPGAVSVMVGDMDAGIEFVFSEQGDYSHWNLYHVTDDGIIKTD